MRPSSVPDNYYNPQKVQGLKKQIAGMEKKTSDTSIIEELKAQLATELTKPEYPNRAANLKNYEEAYPAAERSDPNDAGRKIKHGSLEYYLCFSPQAFYFWSSCGGTAGR
jgi:hypothetical protein